MSKISVTLRKRERASGKVTLYLDIYANGERKVENLHLFLLPGTDSKTKQHNKNVLAAAEVIRSRTYMEYVDGMAFKNKKSKDVRIGEYIDKVLASKSDVSRRYHDEFLRSKALFIETAGDIRMADITADTIRAYIKTLNTTANLAFREDGHLLSSTSKHALYSRINHVLIRAVKEGIIPSNPTALLDKNEKPKKKSKEREFLTLEEVQKLAVTPCPSGHMLKEAFLFCCFTGLRISDIRTLTWDMIDGARIIKEQKKTGGDVQIPLSANAMRWLPERGEASGDAIIFKDVFVWQGSVNRGIKDWTSKAGIKKKVTFHCSRHTFATLLLNNGADIFTTSKLLGHTNIATTQIYAHLLDKKKEEAVSLIPDLDLSE